jgi:hypothetical protein
VQPTCGHYPEPHESSQHPHPVSWTIYFHISSDLLWSLPFPRVFSKIFMPFLSSSPASHIYPRFFLDFSTLLIRWRVTSHYTIFSILLSLPLSQVQILSSALCSLTPSISVLHLGWKTKFWTLIKQEVKLQYCEYIILMVLDMRWEGKWYWTEW